MSIRDGLIAVIIAGLVVGIFFLYGSTSIPRQPKSTSSVQKTEVVGVEPGAEAPELNLTTLGGESISLSQYKGKPVLVTFWTTWCGYCRNEMPAIQRAFDRYKGRVQFLLVNVTANDDEKKVAKFIKDKKYSFPVVLDKLGKGSTDYDVRGLPTTFLVSAEGKIQLKKPGIIDFDELERVLNESLE